MGKRLKKVKAVNGIVMLDSNLPIVKIYRVSTSDQGTFGKLIINDFKCFTGELPENHNIPNYSCIPVGSYKCEWTRSTRLKRFTYEVLEVPERAGIRIHSANFMGDDRKGYKKQVNGCIAFGEYLGQMDKQQALLISKPTVFRFELMMNKEPFILEIK